MNASPTPATSPPRAVALPAITACLFWATAFAAIKGALQYTDSAVTLAGLRFFVAGCILVPFNGHPRNYVAFLRHHWRTVLLVSLFQTVILYGLMFWGMTMVRGAQAAIVMGAIPLISAVFAHVTMRDDRMTLRKIAFIMLGMAGVSIIGLSSKPWGEAGPTECIGLAVLLLSQCSSVTGNIIIAKRKVHLPPALLNSTQIGMGGIALMLIGTVVEGVPHVPTAPAFYGLVLWLALISAIGFTVWFHLLKYVPVSKLNMWSFVTPVFGAIFSWLLIAGESPDLLSIVGMAAVALAMILSQSKSSDPRPIDKSRRGDRPSTSS